MKISEMSEKVEHALPKSAPHWAKKNPLATVSTVVTTIAAAVAIFAWLGIKPASPLGLDEAYVTHQQFNLLMVNIVKSVETIEKELESIKEEVIIANQMSRELDEMNAVDTPALSTESNIDPETAIINPEPIVEEIVVTPHDVKPPKIESPGLKGAFESIQRLQMEQRTLRK